MGERLLCLQMKFLGPNLRINWAEPSLAPAYQNTPYAALYLLLKKEYTQNIPLVLSDLKIACEQAGNTNQIDVLILKGEMDFFGFMPSDAINEAAVLQETIINEGKKRRRAQLSAAISEAEFAKDTNKLNQLLAEFREI